MFDARGQIKVFVCQAACIVSTQCEENFVVANINIGMVVGFFGEFGHAPDKSHGCDEIFKLKLLADGVAVQSPAAQTLQLLADVFG